MCGLVGILRAPGTGEDESEPVRAMTAALSHRGPDDHGEWWDRDGGAYLGHRRLAVVDLSAAGRQPMHSPSGRYVVAFNGEIYNHRELRLDLEHREWLGTSDTETLAVAIESWGLERTMQRCTGMFALAVWDRHRRRMQLVRDRFGEKPLYYGVHGPRFYFASELKALEAHPRFERRLSRAAVSAFLRHGYVPAPLAIYDGIRKLRPGAFVEAGFDRNGVLQCDERRYWDLGRIVASRQPVMHGLSDDDIVGEAGRRLRNVVSGQKVADVPVGAFLSGGVDSSLVVAALQANSTRPVRTFTIGFREAGYDEAVFASRVARHLGTDHVELYVTDRDAMAVVPRLAQIYDEPFGDASAIPTLLVSELAGQHVTVALSGDGGDEVFGGYPRYQRTARYWNWLRRCPLAVREQVARLARRSQAASNRYPAAASALESDSAGRLYTSLVCQWPEFGSSAVLTDAELVATNATSDPVEQMMLLDAQSYLPDDILCKVDRAAMSVSLETRVPMLDHSFVEFAWSLPYRAKLREGRGKWLLRELLGQYVPRELTDRPKMGFAVPVDAWLRHGMKDWAEDLLRSPSGDGQGLFDLSRVHMRWKQHLSGEANWRDPLWIFLQLQDWLRQRRVSEIA